MRPPKQVIIDTERMDPREAKEVVAMGLPKIHTVRHPQDPLGKYLQYCTRLCLPYLSFLGVPWNGCYQKLPELPHAMLIDNFFHLIILRHPPPAKGGADFLSEVKIVS